MLDNIDRDKTVEILYNYFQKDRNIDYQAIIERRIEEVLQGCMEV